MAAPKTVLTYPLNGTLKDFTIPFEYLARKFVTVTLRGATKRTLVLNSEYRFTTKTTITTTSAWGPAQGFDSIEIRRVTSATERLVDFSDGSILRAYDLNTSQVQSLHIAEEARDLTADTIGVNNDGNLDARSRRIVNLADAINPGDAVSLRQNQQWAGSALNQANASQASASASYNYRVEAMAARDSALAYRDSAYAYRVDAMASKDSAAKSAESAETSNQEARTWAANSLSAATASGASASQAAQKLTDTTAQADRAKTEADRAKAEADKLGGMNDMAANIDATGIGAGNWRLAFKGIVEAVGKMFGKKFEAKPYDEGLSFVQQRGTEAPFFLKGTSLKSESTYRPIVKNRVTINGGAEEAVSFGILSEPSGRQNAVIHWDGAGLATTPLLSMDRAGSQATFPGSVIAGGTLTTNNGIVAVRASSPAANSHTWHYHSDGSSRGVLYMDNACNYHVQLNGREHVVFYAAGHTGFNGRITANDVVASGNVYAGSGNAYLATDGNVYGGVWGGWLSSWVNNNFLNIASFGPQWVEYARTRTVHDLGAYCLCLAHNNSGIEWNDLVAGGNLTGTHTGGSYFAGYTMPGTWRRMGRLTNADGSSPDSTTLYVRLA